MEIRILDGLLENFIESLEKPTIAKVLRTVDLLERFGSRLGLPHSRIISARLYELRIRGAQEVRIFYTFHKSQIFLLRGFIKKSEKTPKKEIQAALQKLKKLE